MFLYLNLITLEFQIDSIYHYNSHYYIKKIYSLYIRVHYLVRNTHLIHVIFFPTISSNKIFFCPNLITLKFQIDSIYHYNSHYFIKKIYSLNIKVHYLVHIAHLIQVQQTFLTFWNNKMFLYLNLITLEIQIDSIYYIYSHYFIKKINSLNIKVHYLVRIAHLIQVYQLFPKFSNNKKFFCWSLITLEIQIDSIYYFNSNYFIKKIYSLNIKVHYLVRIAHLIQAQHIFPNSLNNKMFFCPNHI